MGAACSRIGEDDIIIPVVGRPGAGKSTFINTAVGRDVMPIHVSEAGTQGLQYVKCLSPDRDGCNIVFVEITLSVWDMFQARMIERLRCWFTESSLQGLKVPGILYLDCITNIEPVSTFNHLALLGFGEGLCQLLSVAQVTVVTTMWGILQSPSVGIQRAKELGATWARSGSPQQDCAPRFMQFGDSFESAWSIVYACMGGSGSDGPSPHPGHVQSNSFSAARVLISRIIRNSIQKALVAKLAGEDAQCMVDFLNIVLHEDGILDTDEGKSLLALICRLAKSAQIFPQCYELKGVQCDFTQPREGGSFADIFKGEYANQAKCFKVVRIFKEQDNTQMLRAHVKELILWAHLSHRNILPFDGVYLFGKEPQRICIVCPWIRNGNLSNYLAAFPQTPRMPLVSGVIAGLSHVHRVGVVHGDLKARNILVSDDGRALIADFGISRVAMITAWVTTRLSNGTMRWMAPEVLKGGNDFSPTRESDVWSFGCLCYEIFTRRVPFYHLETDWDFIFALHNQKVPMRPAVDNQLDKVDDRIWDLMQRCWDYDPHNRPSCEDIQQRIVSMGAPENQQGMSPLTSGTEMRRKAEVMVDFERAHKILLKIQQSYLAARHTDLFVAAGSFRPLLTPLLIPEANSFNPLSTPVANSFSPLSLPAPNPAADHLSPLSIPVDLPRSTPFDAAAQDSQSAPSSIHAADLLDLIPTVSFTPPADLFNPLWIPASMPAAESFNVDPPLPFGGVAQDSQSRHFYESLSRRNAGVGSRHILSAAAKRRKRNRKHECNICGDRFTSKQNLGNHLNAHSGINPYRCSHCRNDYRHSRSLNRHLLKEHGIRPRPRRTHGSSTPSNL